MKRNNKSLRIIGALALVCCALALVCCTGNKDPQSTTTTKTDSGDPQSGSAEYKVSVVDYAGRSVKDVIVNIKQGSENKAMKVQSADSVSFTLERGDYSVELAFPGGQSYYYDASKCTLSAEKTSLEIKLYTLPTQKETIFAVTDKITDHAPFEAYFITEGGSYVQLSTDKRTFFLFAPTHGGTYKVGCLEESGVTLGYYGSTFNVMANNMAEKDGNALVLDVQNSMVGGVWVIGVDSEQSSCVLTLDRIGDPATLVENEPWIPYTESKPVDFYESSANRVWEDFQYIDLKDDNVKAVYNEEDGVYHLGSKDGPVIYIALGKDTKYIDSIKTICESQRMGVYVYDDKGNFVCKQSFNELFMQYDFGTVPLTEKLAYAIKSFGDKNQWWNFESQSHIFPDDYMTIVRENAWLFACGTFGGCTDSDAGSQSSPIQVSSEEGAKLYIEGGETLFVSLAETNNRELVITGVNSKITVIYNGREYELISFEEKIALDQNVKELKLVCSEGFEGDYLTLEIKVK